MSILDYNGSAMIAMTGKDCVAIVTDKRLGINQFTTISENFPKVFQMNDSCFVGLSGLATDIQTMHKNIKYRMNLYALREQHEMSIDVLKNLVAFMLYERRFSPFLVFPIVAGMDKNGNPKIASYDMIGSITDPADFVIAGSASDNLYGICEAFYKPNLEEEELFETISQCFLAGIDRSPIAGWGGVVHIITSNKIITREIETRMD